MDVESLAPQAACAFPPPAAYGPPPMPAVDLCRFPIRLRPSGGPRSGRQLDAWSTGPEGLDAGALADPQLYSCEGGKRGDEVCGSQVSTADSLPGYVGPDSTPNCQEAFEHGDDWQWNQEDLDDEDRDKGDDQRALVAPPREITEDEKLVMDRLEEGLQQSLEDIDLIFDTALDDGTKSTGQESTASRSTVMGRMMTGVIAQTARAKAALSVGPSRPRRLRQQGA